MGNRYLNEAIKELDQETMADTAKEEKLRQRV